MEIVREVCQWKILSFCQHHRVLSKVKVVWPNTHLSYTSSCVP